MCSSTVFLMSLFVRWPKESSWGDLCAAKDQWHQLISNCESRNHCCQETVALYSQRAHNALTPWVLWIFIQRSLAPRTAHLARACCACDKCVVRAYSALPQFSCPMSTQNSCGPYRVSTCSALTSVRTDFCSIKNRRKRAIISSPRCRRRHKKGSLHLQPKRQHFIICLTQ